MQISAKRTVPKSLPHQIYSLQLSDKEYQNILYCLKEVSLFSDTSFAYTHSKILQEFLNEGLIIRATTKISIYNKYKTFLVLRYHN